MKELVEATQKLEAKQKNLKGIYDEAGKDVDLSLVKSNGFPELANTTARVARIKELDEELNGIMDEITQFRVVVDAKKATEEREKMLTTAVNTVVHPKGGDGVIIGRDGQPIMSKSLGRMFVESDEYKKRNGNVVLEKGYYQDRDLNLKTLFETTAGFDPESIRSGLILPKTTRPIQIIDLVPSGSISQAVEVYMEQTTRTSGAQGTAEGGAFGESTFVYTERTEAVVKRTNSLPVTDEQLEDEARISSIISDDLMFMLRQDLDNQLLNGNGTAPNLTGYNNKSGILTQSKGVDSVPDAIYKLMTKIRVTGRAIPTATILHPNDFQQIRLLTTADGVYIFGSPSEVGADRIWGVPVALSDAQTENTGLVGDFSNPIYSQLLTKRGITLKITDSHSTDFVNGKQMIRVDHRIVFVIRRAAAFGQVTGI